MKKYVIISGLNTSDNNRGTEALGYGSINFCVRNGLLNEGQELANFLYVKKFWKKEHKDYVETYAAEGSKWIRKCIHVFFLEKCLYDIFHILLPFTKFGKVLRNTDLVAAINGGDGFSDIYGTQLFFKRLTDINIAMRENIPFVILPQTIGPFKKKDNYEIAKRILLCAREIYVRDNKFVDELLKMGVQYSLTKDLSAFMDPQPWNIDIPQDSIGINVSGLCYSNRFHSLKGQFDNYPDLVNSLISHFQQLGKYVFLIPHSYRYGNPDPNNDDMEACQMAYDRLNNKEHVILLNQNLKSPQVKYVISKMSFFIGTRMHANFAAIYTGVPLFGLAYSYKFAGAFNANGLDGDNQTAMINNLSNKDIDRIVLKINAFYNKSVSSKNINNK